MRIAFYAPLKAPDHPIPSGDRRIGRLLIQALRLAGHDVTVVSRFRTRDEGVVEGRAGRIADLGARLAERLGDRLADDPPDLWFTYHLYYKAPDYLGPVIAARFGIPYVVAEASVAGKRAGLRGHAAVMAALGRVDLAIGLNPADREGVLPCLASPERWLSLLPFLEAMPPAVDRPARAGVQLLSVAMMRAGDKLASYRLLAKALTDVRDADWQLNIAGDGPVRADVEAAFSDFGARVTFVGLCDEAALDRLYSSSDVLVWPAVNEAFGMALLEAQAAGLPVIAGDVGGVSSIVRDGLTGLTPPVGDVDAFADRLRLMISQPALRRAFGRAARDTVRRDHLIEGAAARLDHALRRLR